MWYRLLLVGVLLSLSACTSAPDTGYWTGTATYQDAYGRTQYCSSAQFDVSHTEHFLEVNRITFYCDSEVISWGPASFDLHDDTAVRYGQNVGWGKIDGSAWLDLSDPVLDKSVTVHWYRSGEFLVYQEDVRSHSGSYVINATLRKSF